MLRKHVEKPWINYINDGTKTTGQKGLYDDYIGKQIIIFNNIEVVVVLEKVEYYDTLPDHLSSIDIFKCAPHLFTYDDVYKAYVNVYEEITSGINAEAYIKSKGGIRALYVKKN